VRALGFQLALIPGPGAIPWVQDISTLEIHSLPISAARLAHKNTRPPALHIRLSLLEVCLRGPSIAPDFKNISLKTLQTAIFVHL
jgi:hypothetical protein